MEAEEIREYCLSKKAVTEGFPFDNETLVFKIGGKMFLLVSLEVFVISIITFFLELIINQNFFRIYQIIKSI